MLEDFFKSIVALVTLINIIVWGGILLFFYWEYVVVLLISWAVIIFGYIIYKMPNE